MSLHGTPDSRRSHTGRFLSREQSGKTPPFPRGLKVEDSDYEELRRGKFSQVVAKAIDDELEAVGDTELAEDRSHVVPHRGFTDEQSLRDLFVLESRPHERNDLALPCRELGNLGGFRVHL